MIRGRAEGVQISSVRPRWGFVAEVPLPDGYTPRECIALDLRVDAGTVGVAFLGSDHTTVSGEVAVGVAYDGVIKLFPEAGGECTSLIVRSIDPGDRPSVVTIRSIELR